MALYHLLGQRLASPVLALPRSLKRAIVLCIDAALCILAVYFAFYLRLGYWVDTQTPTQLTAFYIASYVALCISIPIFILSGLYRAIFRYSGLPALFTVTKAVGVYTILYIGIFVFVGVQAVPRTVGLIQPILLLLMVGASRALANIWLGGSYLKILNSNNLPRVLIYGAGSSGRQLAGAMANSHEMRVVGFLDDNPELKGSVINGLRVYSPQNIAKVIQSLNITDVLLALPSINRSRRKVILEQVTHAKVRVRTLPGLMDLANGNVSTSDIRDLEIEDLLSRDAIDPDPLLLEKNIQGKVVMVTGAGGSIGSELCRQILLLKPIKLILIDHSEADLYKIQQDLLLKLELLKNSQGIAIICKLASILDEDAIETVFKKERPFIVYHAAAYKHVPIVEENPFEGIKNNVFGTLVLTAVARKFETPYFVLISTDKAVRSTNIMGVSKRLAELILQSFAHTESSTIFTMVRFGNVLASSGSVIPLFRRQIRDGGPITVTDLRMTRYFMTIPEAAQLVIQAGAIAKGGEVFLLDMGEPVKIIDLARNMIELSGLQVRDEESPDGDIEIHEIGMRPGEKLYEELLISGNPEKTVHPRIFKSRENFYSWEILETHLKKLRQVTTIQNLEPLIAVLTELVPEYNPQVSDLNGDQKSGHI
ncbi:polysaccharide biosynthesis protein [Polynucleobacter paneuropaeus]|jgi:FlaA1/EpsC-like NDP-sugar epimerase|uniref:polysaccharide biosynthesis protein n=1 Tax=Polynucleobacter paneuropaeus TaxID=2527775 RepID=UPI001BFDBD3C|nr:nucleoside-diphosphate sugar epimerase/dehydratase [Polynucleobacter paneuropaeus]MBT8633223.1 polysaccharide biosynthesis protein [Polynucleobacter paneuropaeus]